MKGGVEKKEIEIFLFRHGKTEANEKHLYCGKTDLPLSEKGRAELLEKKENCLYPDISHCKIFTSGMKRTSQSLGILYPEIISPEKKCVLATLSEGSSFENDRFSEIAIEPSFREIDFGDFEMKSYEELKTNPEYQKWLNGEAENPCPNGESWLQMQNRVITALEKAIKNYRSLAVFTHGGPISAIMGYFFPNERKSLYDWQPDFGEGYKILLEYDHSDDGKRGSGIGNHHSVVFQSSRYEKIPSKKGKTC